MNVLTYWCMNVLTYERTDVWTSERMNIHTYECTYVWADDWINLWADGCQALCMNDRKNCRLNVLQLCHSYDCPSDLPPTEISVGYDKNGRIMSVFGRMDFNYFFGKFFGFSGIFLFFHSFAASVKRYFCLGCFGCSGYSRSIAPSSNAGLR